MPRRIHCRPKGRTALFGVVIVAAFFSFSGAHAQTNEDAETSPESRRIREIRIDIAPIYTDEKAAESSWKATTNKWHIPTRPAVVRRALLFDEGDVLDQELVESSERVLRQFRFLNKAEIEVVPVDENTVDIEVTVKDAWSIEPGMTFDGGGGLTTITAHIIDFNVLGSGKKLFAEAINESDVGTSWKFGYSDYQLFGSHWTGSLRYKTGPLVDSTFLQARLPLYSPDSKWAYGGYAYSADKIVRRFEEGVESSRFNEESDAAGMFVTRSFGERFKKTNLKLQLKYLKADFSEIADQTTGDIPPDQENLTPTISVSNQDLDWVQYRYLDKQGLVEDQWLGIRYGAKLGYGIPIGDSIELWDTRIFALKRMRVGKQQLVELNGSVSSEVVRNTFVNLSARYYKPSSRHTIALNFQAQLGYDLDPSRQLTLGADSGLRGYPARQFTGDKKLIVNLEDRQHWGAFNVGPKFNFGTVLFVDAGNVWKEDEDVDLVDLNWSAGFGFRIGTANMPGQPILQLDFGWPINSDVSSGLEVTIGTEQHF